MVKKSALTILMVVLCVGTAFAGGDKDYHSDMALANCADCAYQVSSDEVGFGNIGIGYSESHHAITFSSGTDTVGDGALSDEVGQAHRVDFSGVRSLRHVLQFPSAVY